MLRSPSKKEIFMLHPDAVRVVDGIAYPGPFPAINPANIVSCVLTCPSDGAKRVVRIKVDIPADTCGCVTEWGVTLKKRPDLSAYEINSTYPSYKFYDAVSRTGAPLTNVAAAKSVAESIAADPFAFVTAVQTNSAGTPTPTGEYITITAKFDGYTFDSYIENGAGSVTVVTPGSINPLSKERLYKMFPVQHGKFGEIPPAIFCGDYCIMTVKYKNCCPTRTPSDSYVISNMDMPGTVEYEFTWAIKKNVTADLNPAQLAQWEPFLHMFPCLIGELSISGSSTTGPEIALGAIALACAPTNSSIAYTASGLVASTSATVEASTDGVTWTPVYETTVIEGTHTLSGDYAWELLGLTAATPGFIRVNAGSGIVASAEVTLPGCGASRMLGIRKFNIAETTTIDYSFVLYKENTDVSAYSVSLYRRASGAWTLVNTLTTATGSFSKTLANDTYMLEATLTSTHSDVVKARKYFTIDTNAIDVADNNPEASLTTDYETSPVSVDFPYATGSAPFTLDVVSREWYKNGAPLGFGETGAITLSSGDNVLAATFVGDDAAWTTAEQEKGLTSNEILIVRL